MKNKTDRIHSDELADRNKQADEHALEKKWGVSRKEIEDAIAKVGNDRTDIEEYLVNKKWQKQGDNDEPSFQKRELNEDETY